MLGNTREEGEEWTNVKGKRIIPRQVANTFPRYITSSNNNNTDKMADFDASHVFTCISCAVAFNDPALQRQHFASDWHRYNMKVCSPGLFYCLVSCANEVIQRRVASLPPVSATNFNAKVIERREQTAVKPDPRSMQCDACRYVLPPLPSLSSSLLTNHPSARTEKHSPPKTPTAHTSPPKNTASPNRNGPSSRPDA